MGSKDSVIIKEQIDKQYRYVKKYHDPLYGEITIINKKETSQQFILIQKVCLNKTKQLTKAIQQSVNHPKSYLLQLNRMYNHKVDICSTAQQHFYILNYYPSSLADQIRLRQKSKKQFTSQQLHQIFFAYIRAAIHLTSIEQPPINTYQPISNFCMAYSEGGVKGIRQIFTNKLYYNTYFEEPVQQTNKSNCCIVSQQRNSSIESKKYNQLLTQENIVFFIGINFMECVLLTDLTQLYQDQNRNYRIRQLLEEISAKNIDSNLKLLLQNMTHPNPHRRPNLKQIEQYMVGTPRSISTFHQMRHSMHSFDTQSNQKGYHILTKKQPIYYRH